MKFLLFFLICLSGIQSFSQTLTGKVVSTKADEPLIYVSIGVIDTNRGTITNEQGNFILEIKDIPESSQIRFSMIGFKSKTFSIKELSGKNNIIQLDELVSELPEITVRPAGKPRKIGTRDYTPGNLCGWGGADIAKGYEIGTQLNLGIAPVRIISLHLHLYKQSFDSSTFRLHVRNIIDNAPRTELLNRNIFISLTEESGWINIDLSKYNLTFTGDIVLSLEWIKVNGIIKDRMIRMNGQKQPTANILFNEKKNKGCMYTRWGSEAKWVIFNDRSPSIYLTIQ
jgi:hypothetical protein